MLFFSIISISANLENMNFAIFISTIISYFYIYNLFLFFIFSIIFAITFKPEKRNDEKYMARYGSFIDGL